MKLEPTSPDTGCSMRGCASSKAGFPTPWPAHRIEQLAVLRLDGDPYESTTDTLFTLYPRLSVGGYVLIDDYGAWEPCRAAVDDYRAEHQSTDETMHVDWATIHWQRSA